MPAGRRAKKRRAGQVPGPAYDQPSRSATICRSSCGERVPEEPAFPAICRTFPKPGIEPNPGTGERLWRKRCTACINFLGRRCAALVFSSLASLGASIADKESPQEQLLRAMNGERRLPVMSGRKRWLRARPSIRPCPVTGGAGKCHSRPQWTTSVSAI